MSHLDEGTLHALLDGELETTEVAEIQAHLGSCSACGLRLREVKEFLAEADRLIASVELGTQPVGAGPSSAQREAAGRPEPAARRDAPAPREPLVRPRPTADAPPREPWNEPPPMLLIPDNESAAERRARRLKRMGWAALMVGVVGAGFLGVRFRPQPTRMPALARATPAESSAVVSPEEASRPDSVTQRSESSTLAVNDRAAPAAKSRPAPAPPPSAPPAARKDAARSESRRPQLAVRDEAARRPAADTAAETAPAAGEAASPDTQTIDSTAETTTDAQEADSAAGEDLASVRARAGEALAELDRERRRSQAAAATAALDSERRRRTVLAPATAAPTPPAPPTIEQRAQVYLRIGLDEASRQLGGPVHVIEGLSPMFMGLARGAAVSGADATRPVVRVVYQDSQGRLILLDQQRLRSGRAAPSAGPLSWLMGDTAMWLNGEASGDILRTYRPRVR